MRTLLLLLSLLCASCVVRPTIVRTPKGGYVASMGGNFAAKVGPTLAEITTREGDTIKFMSESEDATEVPNTAIMGWVAREIAATTAGVEKAKDANATKLGITNSNNAIKAKEIEAAGKATTEGLGAGAEAVVLPIKPPGS